MESGKQRDLVIDFLRTIGILLIFLAHTDCPFILKQFRIFDVILLVSISGYVYTDQFKNFKRYLRKRIKRLILPVWFFLTFFFISLFLMRLIVKIPDEIVSLKNILLSYFCWSGIGFVWIIRIYIVVAILGPILLKKIQLPGLILYYFLIEIIIKTVLSYNDTVTMRNFLTMFPYVIIFCYGYFIKTKQIPIKVISVILSMMVAIFYLKYGVVDISDYKYPPERIYIWYGILMTNVLFMVGKKIRFEKLNLKVRKLIEYIGSSSMWFYLLHILVYYVIYMLKKRIYINWIIEYSMLVFISFILLVIKDKIRNYLSTLNSEKLNCYLEILKG